jgi:hypothetical protein
MTKSRGDAVTLSIARRRVLAGLSACGVVGVSSMLAGCDSFSPNTGYFNFEWTVFIIADNKDLSASTVFGMYIYDRNTDWASTTPIFDLGEWGLLLALVAAPEYKGYRGLKYAVPQSLISLHYYSEYRSEPTARQLELSARPITAQLLRKAQRVDIPADVQEPIFALAPKSARKISDLTIIGANDLAQHFGSGWRYVGMRLEPTTKSHATDFPLETSWWDEIKTNYSYPGQELSSTNFARFSLRSRSWL